MSKLLSPKAWYLVAVGGAALVADGTRRIIRRRRQHAAELSGNGHVAAEVVEDSPETTRQPATPVVEAAVLEGGPDDLTQLKGIGPTFARRLAEAGYTSFTDIANATADELREATKAPRVANPDEWIVAAKARL